MRVVSFAERLPEGIQGFVTMSVGDVGIVHNFT